MNLLGQITFFFIFSTVFSAYGMNNFLSEDYKKLPGSKLFKKHMKNISVGKCYRFLVDNIETEQTMMQEKFNKMLWWLPGKHAITNHMVKGMIESKKEVGDILQEADGKTIKEEEENRWTLKKLLTDEILKNKKITQNVSQSIGSYTAGILLDSLKRNQEKASEVIVLKMIMNKKENSLVPILEKCVGFVIGKCVKKEQELKKFFGLMAKTAYGSVL